MSMFINVENSTDSFRTKRTARIESNNWGKISLQNSLGYKTFQKIYESCVCLIMDYGSGVWCHCQNENRPSPQDSNAMFLGVNKFAPKHGIEGDMGCVPPIIRRKKT